MSAVETYRSVRFTLPTEPVARVFHQIRAGAAHRTTLQEDLGLSQASVTRHVSALIAAGLVEEARPVTDDGARAGRPRTVLTVDGRHRTVWAAHIGVRSSVLVVADLAGRVLREQHVPWDVRRVSPARTLEQISSLLGELAAGMPAPANVGIAFSAHVDEQGLVSSPTYRWSAVDAPALLPFPATLGTGVAAMASTEIVNTPLGSPHTSSILYFYAREVIAHAWIFNGTVHRPKSGRTPAAFRGHLGASDTVDLAARRGVTAGSIRELAQLSRTDATARAVLDERARGLGQAVTAAVDIVDPDAVVFAGEAFTADPEGLRVVVQTVRAQTESMGQLRIQRADANILRTAALQVALDPVRQNPLAFA